MLWVTLAVFTIRFAVVSKKDGTETNALWSRLDKVVRGEIEMRTKRPIVTTEIDPYIAL